MAPIPPYSPWDGFMLTGECTNYCNRESASLKRTVTILYKLHNNLNSFYTVEEYFNYDNNYTRFILFFYFIFCTPSLCKFFFQVVLSFLILKLYFHGLKYCSYDNC